MPAPAGRGTQDRRALWRLVGGVVLLIGVVVIAISPRFLGSSSTNHRAMTCLYTRGGVSGLQSAERALGVSASCSLAFDGGSNWATWAAPWFVEKGMPNNDWAGWVRAKPGRQLIADIQLVPTGVAAQAGWRAQGAAGAFSAYDRLLATVLVRSGLGNAYVRLGNEANGAWEPDWIGTTKTQWHLWRELWRRTALAMSSVPGAHFHFVWCISPGVGHVPLGDYYPGNDVVNAIGVDIYDTGLLDPGPNRWTSLLGAGGIQRLLDFASAQGKPVAIPEWGLWSPPVGGGDDPAVVRGVADLSRQPGTVLQDYFYAGITGAALASSPRSLAAYRRAFR